MKRSRLSNIYEDLENAEGNNDGSIILFDNDENEVPDTVENDDNMNDIDDEEINDEDKELLKEYVLLFLYLYIVLICLP